MRIVNILIASLLIFIIGCGDSSRNDQGASFTFFGWFEDSTGTIGRSGFITPLTDTAGPGIGISYLGVQNNLAGQGIRIQRVYHEYIIPGATISVPDTSVAAPAYLGPANPEAIDTTLPDTFGGETLGTVAYIGVPVIPAAIQEFIVLNKEQFPEPPFVMTVRSKVVGLTSAGQELISNPIEIDVHFTPPITINGI